MDLRRTIAGVIIFDGTNTKNREERGLSLESTAPKTALCFIDPHSISWLQNSLSR